MEHSGLPPDPHKALGIGRDAGIIEIRSALRRLVLKCHPDKFPHPILKAQKQEEKERQKYHERLDRAGEKAFKKKAAKEDLIERRASQRKYALRSGILVVKGWINNLETQAIPDTGAEYNIISASFADDLGLEVHNQSRTEQKLLRLANGKQIRTCGLVRADWHFPRPQSEDTDEGATYRSLSKRRWRLTFHVLNEVLYDLVLGNGFLMKTKTMSHFKERLTRIPRPLGALSVLRVSLLGMSSQRIRGVVGGLPVWALPDSGSEPSLLSWNYVTQRSWATDKLDLRDQRLLQFADGSVARTEGSIKTRWSFARPSERNRLLGVPDIDLEIEFHVFRDCPYDTILGQDVLEETDAFLTYQESFEYVEPHTEIAAMNLVIFARAKKKARQVPGADVAVSTSNNHALHDELQRRAVSDRQRRLGRRNSYHERRDSQSPRDRNKAVSQRGQQSDPLHHYSSELEHTGTTTAPGSERTPALSEIQQRGGQRSVTPQDHFRLMETRSEAKFNDGSSRSNMVWKPPIRA